MAGLIKKAAKQAARVAKLDYARLDATTDAEIERQMLEGGEAQAEYTPWHPAPLQVRQSLGLTQQAIAVLLGVPVATWRNWEQGRTIIDAPGRALLIILAREPEAVVRAMQREVA